MDIYKFSKDNFVLGRAKFLEGGNLSLYTSHNDGIVECISSLLSLSASITETEIKQKQSGNGVSRMKKVVRIQFPLVQCASIIIKMSSRASDPNLSQKEVNSATGYRLSDVSRDQNHHVRGETLTLKFLFPIS